MHHRFTVRARPIAKGRPRFGQKRVFPPKRTAAAEAVIAAAYNGPYFDGPISMSCVFHLDRTVITIKSLDDDDQSPLQGDTTNYLKTVEDALNGVAYADDKQILRVRGSKK